VSDIGDVVVHDPAKGVFVRYNRDGSYRDQIPAPAVLTTSLRQVEQIDAALVMWARASVDGDRVDRLLWVTPGDATALIGGKPSYRSTAHHARCGVTFGVGVPLAPRLFWSQAGNRVATVTSPDFRIDVFDEGRHVRQVWMGEASPELSRAEAISILTADSVIGPCNSSPDEFVDLHGYFPRLQYVRDMSIDPDGRLWVTWREPGGEDRMVLFDETGQAVGLLPPGFPMPLSFLADGRMLLRVVDGLGVERIGIGRIAPG
jgi:hypothetical protein